MKLWMTIIGILAAVGTTGAWLPQYVKTWRTRCATDFSWTYLALMASGVALWLVYGVLRHDAVIIIANATTLVLMLMVMFVKYREAARARST